MSPSTALRRAGARVVRTVGTRRHADDPERWLDAATAIMRSATYCTLVTTGTSGASARVVQPFPPDADLAVHPGTDPTSRKALDIEAAGTAMLVYQRDRDHACAVAYCRAELLHDEDSRRRYFMPMWRAFWPQGPSWGRARLRAPIVMLLGERPRVRGTETGAGLRVTGISVVALASLATVVPAGKLDSVSWVGGVVVGVIGGLLVAAYFFAEDDAERTKKAWWSKHNQAAQRDA